MMRGATTSEPVITVEALSGGAFGPEGAGQFVLKQSGNLEQAAVIRKGEFVNRAYDSRFGTTPNVSGPLGRSFSPGSGMPTTAAETIESRGLDIYSTNNAEQGIIFRATENIPATARTAIEGVDPELLIESGSLPKLKEMNRFPITNGVEIRP